MDDIAVLHIRTPPCDSDSDAEDAYRLKTIKRRNERCVLRILYTIGVVFALYTFLQYDTVYYNLYASLGYLSKMLCYLVVGMCITSAIVTYGVKLCTMLGWCKAQEDDQGDMDAAAEFKKDDDLDAPYSV